MHFKFCFNQFEDARGEGHQTKGARRYGSGSQSQVPARQGASTKSQNSLQHHQGEEEGKSCEYF